MVRGKILIIILIILLLVAVVGGFFVYSAMTSETKAAFLSITRGDVDVDTGSGWQDASDGMELSLNDRIKTNDGNADVILYESVIVSLDPYTEISISSLAREHPKVGLKSGAIWNKFTGLLGVSQFDVETPTTVATVRGTEFGVIHLNGVSEVFVAAGGVDAISEGETVRVGINEIVRKVLGEKMLKEPLSPERLVQVKVKRERMLTSLRTLRAAEVDKNKVLLKLAQTSGVSRKDIRDKLLGVDEGRESEQNLVGMVPIQTESIDKVVDLNKEIREQMEAVGAERTGEDSSTLEPVTSSIINADEPRSLENDMVIAPHSVTGDTLVAEDSVVIVDAPVVEDRSLEEPVDPEPEKIIEREVDSVTVETSEVDDSVMVGSIDVVDAVDTTRVKISSGDTTLRTG